MAGACKSGGKNVKRGNFRNAHAQRKGGGNGERRKGGKLKREEDKRLPCLLDVKVD